MIQTPAASQNIIEHAAVEMDLQAVARVLWRRRVFLLGMVLSGIVLMLLALAVITPRYKALAILLIHDEPVQALSAEMLARNGLAKFDPVFVLNEIEILKSRSMAEAVIRHLEPSQNHSTEGGIFDAPSPESVSGFKPLSVAVPDVPDIPAASPLHQAALEDFMKGLNIRNVPGSSVVQIEYTASSPQMAAHAANAYADTYIAQNLQGQRRSTDQLSVWLEGRLGELQEQARIAQQNVQQFKSRNLILEGIQGLAATEQISRLNTELAQARADKAQIEARLTQMRNAQSRGYSITGNPEAMDSETVQQLRLQELDLQARLSELLLRYGERHPQIIKTRQELEDLAGHIEAETKSVGASLESEYAAAKLRISALEKTLAQAGQNQFQDAALQGELQSLEREAETARLIYESLRETYRRAQEQTAMQGAGARVISYASAPLAPAYPRRGLLLCLAAAVSLFAGCAFVVSAESLDHTFKTPGQLEQATNLPCLSLIPLAEKVPQKDLGGYVLKHPSSKVAEAVRTLRTVINLRAQQGASDKAPPKTITLTSSFPGEGKTTLAVWLARLAARSGQRVILIDADLRRPNVHRTLGVRNDVSLVDFLTGQAELEKVIQKDEASGMHMIYGRSVPNAALDMIASPRMKKLVESLSQLYDLVIIDSPACLAVSDARVLAGMSDQMLYAVAWDETPREAVFGGIKQFSDIGYERISFVLSHVDEKRLVRYGYGDVVYYGLYNGYYAS